MYSGFHYIQRCATITSHRRTSNSMAVPPHSPTSSRQAVTDLLPVDLPVLGILYKWKHPQYVVFCDWLLSLSVFSRFSSFVS